LGRQQRQNGEEDDAAPGEDAKRGREQVSAHRLWLSTVRELARAVLRIWARDRPRWPASVLNNLRTNTRMPPSTRDRATCTASATKVLSWTWPADGDRRRSDRTVEVDACFREGAFD
jgi:hypothetical protein